MSDVFVAKDMNVWYGSFHALKNVNITIPEKSVTALIGPSGCGKSTFLRSLNRMNDLIEGCRVAGTLTFEGRDVMSMDAMDLRHRVGMVFQRPNPFPMSILDNVAYGPRLEGRIPRPKLMDIVEEALRGASLWDEVKDSLNKSGLSLSGGQQQRLCIARALAVKPDVILMDEPTSALDPVATGRIEQLMMHLKQDYTIVVVTHNMQQAARVSDQTCFFMIDDRREGFLVESGKTEDVFFRPKDRRTEEYLAGKFG